MVESTETAMKETSLLRFVWWGGRVKTDGVPRHYSLAQLQALETELAICHRWVREKRVEAVVRRAVRKQKRA
jgi:hypothetical protein